MVKCVAYLLSIAATIVCVITQEEWDYDDHGPATWVEDYPSCGGSRQSPIALSRHSSRIRSLYALNYRIVFTNYNTPINTVFTNNGHTVNLPLNYTDKLTAPQVTISGSGKEKTYYLTSLHFHWPSEHTIEERRYDLEMHMVHANDQNQNLVLGFLFMPCLWSDTGIKVLTNELENIETFENSVRINNFVPSRVMPDDFYCDYFVYSGSLTTPPCSENVTWMVHNEPICIRQDLLKRFYPVMNKEGERMYGNKRPLQNRNDRTVLDLTCFF